ncbi:hypothetical protein LEP1GSC074_3003 [Leptospira noguchii str. Hook]|nr:hypothetical protein LEP1GSC074_3003 [Leptospira noguchii str. Hook]
MAVVTTTVFDLENLVGTPVIRINLFHLTGKIVRKTVL